MADPTCAHRGTAITDRSTMVARGGQTFCCNNCATAAAAGAGHGAGHSGTTR